MQGRLCPGASCPRLTMLTPHVPRPCPLRAKDQSHVVEDSIQGGRVPCKTWRETASPHPIVCSNDTALRARFSLNSTCAEVSCPVDEQLYPDATILHR